MRKMTYLIVLMILLVVGVIVWNQKDPSILQTQPTEEVLPSNQQQEISQVNCESVGGVWNECGSACRENPDAACIQVCVAYCECQNQEECPVGFQCDSFVEKIGVCQPI